MVVTIQFSMSFSLQFAENIDTSLPTESSTSHILVLDSNLLPPQSNITKYFNAQYQGEYYSICLDIMDCDICHIGGDCGQIQADFVDRVNQVK